jgi:hypothetical protein
MIPKEVLTNSQRMVFESEVERTSASERARFMSHVLSDLSLDDLSFEELSLKDDKFDSALQKAIKRRDKITDWQIVERRRVIELQELRERQREDRRRKEEQQQNLKKPRAKPVSEVGKSYDKVFFVLLDRGPMTSVDIEILGLTDNSYGIRPRETSLHQVLTIWRRDLGIVETVPPQVKPCIYKFAVGALDKFKQQYGRLPALPNRELTEDELRRFGWR